MLRKHWLPRFLLSAVAAVACGAFGGHSVWAQNWPQWRGPQHNGVSTEKGFATKWNKTENVAWRLPLPGEAGATPVVWNDKIFLTSVAGEDLLLMCVGTDGKEIWKRNLARGNTVVRKDEGNSASPSPCTDGEHVWAMMTTGDLACFDFAGKEIWKLNLQDQYGKFNIQFGMTSSPVLDGDRLYLQLLHSNGAWVVALDKLTGKEVWKHKRSSDAKAECEHSYASPTLYRDAERQFLLTHGADYIVAHQLENGAEIWRCGGLNPPAKYNPTLRFVASPAVSPGLIVVPSAKNGPVLGLKPDVMGDITGKTEEFKWIRKDNTPDVPSPLISDGLVYLCRENGVLTVLEAETGNELYQQRTHSQRHRASPVYADGKVYLTARDGMVTVVKAGKTFEVLSQNMIDEELSASPAFSNGKIYLRSFEALWAIEEKK